MAQAGEGRKRPPEVRKRVSPSRREGQIASTLRGIAGALWPPAVAVLVQLWLLCRAREGALGGYSQLEPERRYRSGLRRRWRAALRDCAQPLVLARRRH